MKAILKFDLGDSTDYSDFKNAVQASEMAGALFDITHNLRKTIVRRIEAEEINNPHPEDVLDIMGEEIVKALEGHGVNTTNL